MAYSFGIHLVCQILYFLLYAPGYGNLVKAYDKYRINKGVQRPWENEKTWPSTKKKLFLYLGINYLLVYPGLIYISNKLSGIKLRFTEPPSV